MKKTVLAIACIGALAVSGCKKDKKVTTTPPVDFTTLEGQVLTDFSNKLVNPDYQDIKAKAGLLNDAVAAFAASRTDDNLTAMRIAWKNTRQPWELCEGFLFGPVEDNSYDPTIDDWPVNKNDLENLLKSNNPLTVADIDALPTSSKGFHAIEYIIFGEGGKNAASINDRQLLFLTSLTQSLYNTTKELADSWDPAVGNYTAEVINAGKGSTSYTSRKLVFDALVGSMAGICDEVANGKMADAMAISGDSTKAESRYSHNSTTDFTNNIKGILNAYQSSYNGVGGHSLKEMVSVKNASLDKTLTDQMNDAINAFSTLSGYTFEEAVYSHRTQVAAVQAKINVLKKTLEVDLGDFVTNNVKD